MNNLNAEYKNFLNMSKEYIFDILVPRVKGIDHRVAERLSEKETMEYHGPVGYLGKECARIFGYDTSFDDLLPVSDTFFSMKIADDLIDEIGVENPERYLRELENAVLGTGQVKGNTYPCSIIKSAEAITLPHREIIRKSKSEIGDLRETIAEELSSENYSQFHKVSLDVGRKCGSLMYSLVSTIVGSSEERMHEYINELSMMGKMIDNFRNYKDDQIRFPKDRNFNRAMAAFEIVNHLTKALRALDSSQKRAAIKSYIPTSKRCFINTADQVG